LVTFYMEIPAHPHARSYTVYGGAVDVKEHDWVHSNVVFKGVPDSYKPIKQAFATQNPFKALGWNPVIDCPTKTISRWSMQESPVAKYEGHELWVSFESLHSPPFDFLQHVCTKFRVVIEVRSIYPYQIQQKRIHLYPTNH
jgi:hypothetical protein